MEIIPAIDIIGGKCVRLTQGDYSSKTEYNENPVEVAKAFEDAGIKRLHLVDLDGAKQKKIINYKVLEAVASNTSLDIDFGGGVQSDQDIELAFNSGAKQVTGGSIAVKNKSLFLSWLEKYSADKIILGADTKAGMVAVSGWEETSSVSLSEILKEYTSKGISYVICTDIAKDGLLQGPSFDLYDTIISSFPKLKLIASGGVTSVQDLERLKNMGLYGAIVGKAFYEGKLSLSDLSKFSNR